MFSYSVRSTSIFMIFILCLGSLILSVYSYVIPEPTFELLKPRGIKISIPDERGMRFFAFHGNVNKTIALREAGKISGEVYRKISDKWTIIDRHISLSAGDVIHYWSYVLIDETTYTKSNQKWTVTFSADTKEDSTTEQSTNSDNDNNNNSKIRSDKLIFEDTFDSINKSIWKHEIKIPSEPDYEFCVYHNEHHDFLVQNENGILRIKPVILENYYGENVTTYGTLQLSDCTSIISMECLRKAVAFNILPPVISARLTTKDSFSFKYGKIEIRAKFPEGDWLYPEMWLDPRYNNYGANYASGRIILGLARGNNNLVNVSQNRIFDSRRLDFGFRLGKDLQHVEDYIISEIRENGPRWTKDFHVYTTIWDKDGFQFSIDGKYVGKLSPGENGWLQNNGINKMAPFDKEFYITIGVGVGGMRIFPDATISSGYAKPWRNVEAKAMLRFWQARNKWLSSWKQDRAIFEIDYIRVWSL